MNGNSHDATNLQQKLSLTNRQIICQSFTNDSSADIELSETQLPKMIQLGGFLGEILGTLLKTEWPLIKNLMKPLAKNVLIPMRLLAAASAADAGLGLLSKGVSATIQQRNKKENFLVCY